jgi:hypothetical protein
MRDAPMPLLVTDPASKLDLPAGLGLPGGGAWRAAEALGSGFFVTLMTSRSFDTDAPRALIMSWDSDIVAFIESPRMAATLKGLWHFGAGENAGAGASRMREIREIWRGEDWDAPGSEVIVFKASDGSAFCGQDAIPVPATVYLASLITAIASQPEAGR